MRLLHVDILKRVFTYADMETLVLTCRPASMVCLTLVEEEIVERIRCLIGTFAIDVDAMRVAMRENLVFIGGSLSLKLFSPVRYHPNNADLFVPACRYFDLVAHLTSTQLFTVRSVQAVAPSVVVPPDPHQDDAVYSYGAGISHLTTLTRGASVVHILAFPDPTPLAFSSDVLTLSWTTGLFTFVTADFATCAYPALTLMGRGLYHMERFLRGMPGTSSDHKLNAYADRGFEFARHPIWWTETPCRGGWSCPFEVRRFGDGGCLTVPAIGGPVDSFGRRWRFGGVDQSIHDE